MNDLGRQMGGGSQLAHAGHEQAQFMNILSSIEQTLVSFGPFSLPH